MTTHNLKLVTKPHSQIFFPPDFFLFRFFCAEYNSVGDSPFDVPSVAYWLVIYVVCTKIIKLGGPNLRGGPNPPYNPNPNPNPNHNLLTTLPHTLLYPTSSL